MRPLLIILATLFATLSPMPADDTKARMEALTKQIVQLTSQQQQLVVSQQSGHGNPSEIQAQITALQGRIKAAQAEMIALRKQESPGIYVRQGTGR